MRCITKLIIGLGWLSFVINFKQLNGGWVYAMKFFKSLFSNFWGTKICYLNISWVFVRVIHAFINYLKSIQDIFSSFDCSLSLKNRNMFIDISNVFDRIWDDGLFLLKLKQSCVIGNLFQLVTSFLGGIFQRVLRNGQMSYWELIRAGLRVQIVQDSTLGLLVFLA